MSDQEILNALRDGRLKPSMVGLRQFEVRFFADSGSYDVDTLEGRDDLVSVLFEDSGQFGPYLHSSDSVSDEPGDIIEGIGAEYAEYFEGGGYFPTVSYLSDDKELIGRIRDIIESSN